MPLDQIDNVENYKSRRKRALFVAFVATCLILLMLFLVSFEVQDPPPIDQEQPPVEIEIPVEMEKTDAGAKAGGTDAAGPKAPEVTSPPSPPTNPDPPVHTQETSDVTVPSGNPSNSDQGDPGPSNPTPKYTFGGNQGDGGAGDGTNNGQGDGDFGGLGNNGNGPPGPMGGGRKKLKDACQNFTSSVAGKVVLKIYVDKNGNIVNNSRYSTEVVKSKSNVSNSSVINQCKQAVKCAKFDKIDRDIVQWFEYTFNLRPS